MKQADCPLCRCESFTLWVTASNGVDEDISTETYRCLCCDIYWPTEMQWAEYRAQHAPQG